MTLVMVLSAQFVRVVYVSAPVAGQRDRQSVRVTAESRTVRKGAELLFINRFLRSKPDAKLGALSGL